MLQALGCPCKVAVAPHKVLICLHCWPLLADPVPVKACMAVAERIKTLSRPWAKGRRRRRGGGGGGARDWGEEIKRHEHLAATAQAALANLSLKPTEMFAPYVCKKASVEGLRIAGFAHQSCLLL